MNSHGVNCSWNMLPSAFPELEDISLRFHIDTCVTLKYIHDYSRYFCLDWI